MKKANTPLVAASFGRTNYQSQFRVAQINTATQEVTKIVAGFLADGIEKKVLKKAIKKGLKCQIQAAKLVCGKV